MLEFLPDHFLSAVHNLNMNFLYEIRMRADKPTMIRFREQYVYLTKYGYSERMDEALIATKADIEETLMAAGKYSIYSVEEQLKQGFLTANGGVRIGIAGHYIVENKQIVTVRDFSSLCIRVPHEIIGCGVEIYERFLKDGLKNLLIVSKPGQGKTTILRDLSRILSEKAKNNILICDERGEIAEGSVGIHTDVFLFAEKRTALEIGVRVMRPDVIITDELSVSDYASIVRAKDGGVNIIASMHGSSLASIPKEILGEFDAIILLDSKIIGKISDYFLRNER